MQLTESKIKDELLRSILSKAARLEKTDKIKDKDGIEDDEEEVSDAITDW